MNDNLPRPPVRCASWCRYGTGHTDARLASDQVCYSEPALTRLTIPQPSAARGWASDHHAYVALSLHHETPDDRPEIETGLNDDTGILLTLDEAERYACSILREVQTARAGGQG